MKNLIFSFLFISMLSPLFSQVNVGGQLSYLSLFGGTGISSLGIGLRGDIVKDERTGVLIGLNYYFGGTDPYTTSANALSSTTIPQFIELDAQESYSFIHITAGGKRYFVGDYDGDLNVYGMVDVGYLLAPYKTKITEEYDESLYDAGFQTSETLGNFTIGFGGGVDKIFDFGTVFSELKLNLPANQANGVAVSFDIPASFTFNLGLTIPIGG